MSIRDWWGKRSAQDAAPEPLRTQGMDGFADGILLELKGITTGAITRALQEREGQFMRSILEESFFSLDSLVIRALDAQTARDMESFLSNHESIHPDFRSRFFSQILQREYRSSRGATVRVAPGLAPVIELDPKVLDAPTQDEDFVLSLKGRKVRFEAQALLTGPQSKRSAPPAAAQASAAVTEPEGGEGAGRSTRFSSAVSGARPFAPGQQLQVQVHDRSGVKEQRVALPLVLGREGVQAARQDGHGAGGLDIDATYVSRKQLVVFELLGQVYCTVPAEASLTCSSGERVLQPLMLLPLRPGQSLELRTGLPVDSPDMAADRSQAGDYALIRLSLAGGMALKEGATPRPRGTE